jgi:two-component system invasion response regulator UvrY
MGSDTDQVAYANVLIVDDHETIRRVVRAVLDEAGFHGTVAEAADGLEAVALACADHWDVIILDITLPGLNGLEVLSRVKACRPEQCVVMLSMHASAKHIRGALNAGAMGYLTKETAPDELVDAIRAVLSGQRYLGDDLERLL